MTTIVCWNMQHKRDSWRFLRDNDVKADIALLQEACTPPEDVVGMLDAGPGPWVHSGRYGVSAVVGIRGDMTVTRASLTDIWASAQPPSSICTIADLAVAFVTTPRGESLALVSVVTGPETSPDLPKVMRDIQQHCGAALPCIVGGDLTTWWDSDTTVFADMMRMGLPLIGPHAATFYSPLNKQTPADAQLQLDYVFASRSIAHRVTVRTLNNVDEWGPSDHCRIVIDLAYG